MDGCTQSLSLEHAMVVVGVDLSLLLTFDEVGGESPQARGLSSIAIAIDRAPRKQPQEGHEYRYEFPHRAKRQPLSFEMFLSAVYV